MATPEQEAKAREMGWIPKDNFHGDHKEFIDADEFLSRGERLLPILKANNRKLTTQVKTMGAQLTQVQQQLTETNKALAEFQRGQNRANLDRLEGKRGQLVAAKTAAIQAGDAAGQVEAEEGLRALDGEIQEAKKATGPANPGDRNPGNGTQGTPTVDPAYTSWLAENPWYGQDESKTIYADGVAAHIRRDPANQRLVGEAFYQKVSEKVQSHFSTRQRTPSKVESGGNGSGNGGGGSSGTKSYSDLPPDAKQACDRNSKNPRMVGEGKLHKTAQDYQQAYVAEYFKGEE